MDDLNLVTFELLSGQVLKATKVMTGRAIKFKIENFTGNAREGMLKICGEIEEKWGSDIVYDNFNRICEEIEKQ